MLLVDDNWRWAYWIFAWPTLMLGVWALFVPDPPRGQFEQKSVLGEVMEEEDDPPRVSLGAVWQRLMAIKTLKLAWISFSIIVFSIIGQGFLVNLYLEDRFGLTPFERAMIGFVPGMLAFAAAPWAAKRYDALYRESPARALAWVGALFFPHRGYHPRPVLHAPPCAVRRSGNRARGFERGDLRDDLAAAGGGGSLPAAGPGHRLVDDGDLLGRRRARAHSGRAALRRHHRAHRHLDRVDPLQADRRRPFDLGGPPHPPRPVVGGGRDREGPRRLGAAASTHPDRLPAVGLRDIDFSYGPVQVLFGVNLHVDPGETLALLGTNGAGKSTILRVISGLAVPSRGIVSLHGRDITLTSPQTRVDMEILQLPGGKAVFLPLSIEDNLRTAGWTLRRDRTQLNARIDHVLGIFPELADRLDEPAGALSGGQQQMLALAMVLIHEPDVLLIDELSLGLAPAVIGELFEIIERLRAEGQTMIIVEQSLNIATAISDRAVFIEKGQVRFDGPTAELAERGDIARAVFLGGDRPESEDSS